MDGMRPPGLPTMQLSMKAAVGGKNASGSGGGGGGGVPFSFSDFVLKMDCYAPSMVITNGVWLGDNPMNYSLPLFLCQLLFISLTTRALAALLHPFHQPLVVAEILTGIAFGPTFMSRIFKNYTRFFFPPRSLYLMKTAGHMGLLYFVFIIGLELDSSIFRHTGRKVLSVATAGVLLPFFVTISTAYVLREHLLQEHDYSQAFYVYFGVALSITSFPVLARMLLEIKLMETEIGRIALSAAMIIELLAWILLAFGIAFTVPAAPDEYSPPAQLILLSGFLFTLFCIFAVRPAVGWFLRRTPEGEVISDMDSGAILVGVMLAGLATDVIGIHSAFGAFLYGFVIPPTPHATALIGRVEEFVKDLLLPLLFFDCGFRLDLLEVSHTAHALILVFIFILSNAVKIGVIILIAAFFNLQLLEGVALAFLVNPSGFIILTIALDKKLIEADTYAIILVMNIIMTTTVAPVVTIAYRRSRKHIGYKRRNLQCLRPDSELRLLACVHKSRNVTSIVSLLDLSNPTKKSPIFVYALHLVELSGHASAMLIVDNARNPDSLPLTHPHSEHIIAAFETYEQHAAGVSIQPIVAVSPFSTMHDDVCSVAEDHHAALIILPFHKLQAVDGGMETIHPAIRTLNANVLKHAPCSVGLLVDRGLSAATAANRQLQHVRHVVALFFGGADDREALAYASRMAEQPAVALTVLRFIAKGEEMREEDEECVSEFRLKHVSDESVVYVEKVVSNSEETVAAIRGLTAEERRDLYVVGRGSGESRLTAGMNEWSECPELGPIGDLLASVDFEAASATSVLVVQQYVGESGLGDVAARERSESPTAAAGGVQQYLSNHSASRGGAVGGPGIGGWHGAV